MNRGSHLREPRQVDEESVDHEIFVAKMESRFFPRCDRFFFWLMVARAMRFNQWGRDQKLNQFNSKYEEFQPNAYLEINNKRKKI